MWTAICDICKSEHDQPCKNRDMLPAQWRELTCGLSRFIKTTQLLLCPSCLKNLGYDPDHCDVYAKEDPEALVKLLRTLIMEE